MVSSSTIISIIISMLLSVGVPVVLLVVFRKKYAISIKVLLIGMVTFFLFAQILEGIVHSYFLVINDTTRQLFANPWMYMLYGGLMAGIFEETGRLVMFTYFLKNYREWKDGLSFGLGHGGMEAIVLVGINSVTMLTFAFIINSGSFEKLLIDEQATSTLGLIRDQLVDGPPYLMLLGGVERLSALAIHIGLSILVLYAIKNKKMIYFFLAILLHAVFNFPAALYQKGVLENVFVVETIIAILAIASVFWIVKSQRLFGKSET